MPNGLRFFRFSFKNLGVLVFWFHFFGKMVFKI
jgi:hypothetical protein